MSEQEDSGYLYPVPVEPIYGVNGGPIEGPVGTEGIPLCAAAAAALVAKTVA